MQKTLLGPGIHLVAGIALALGLSAAAGADQRFITIGTGGVTGVYYPTGQNICRLVNRDQAVHGMRCNAESTGGSVFNLNSIAVGEMDFGVAQSDWQHHAYHGTDRFADLGENRELRAVFSLHPEPFTVLVRAESDIESFDDIVGKRVNVGNPGSGQRGTVERLMAEYGWSMDDFALASELPSREQGQALCDNRIDVILFTVGHPSAAIQEPIATCDARLIPVAGPIVDTLVNETPYYFHATIPAGMYPHQDQDIATFGVGATLVTSTQTTENAVYHLTRAVFENFDTFRGMHPAFAVLDPDSMVSQGLSAPLHDGAVRYYRESGMIQD
ncbi:TRAP transporter solute receptor, TAXI family precursor [Thioalkalivibrio nitratireducens DSM 14787]|uniref:TRAP transporter solute receptor, TAXI family n=1 Tax=Thioalkalivibrio nitratireducens (strain DSM 14787 / UNIQEM 213 / ALEN2) TaxID=1255043 RepID=L0DZP3_THIND|nr:TAXI family TRAP transporter solute-binding subunit [Thioalkalivibrio nitratireducens]AGA34518.1 TRAP transporter solute receptor, TAXI family precursor [Thioalkalivibrio nitratireducens DSM 14787]